MTGNSRHLSRRSINALIASVAAWPCSSALSLTVPNQSTTSMRNMLLSLFENPRCAFAIGSAYLKSLPPGARAAERLTNAIILRTECEAEAMKCNRVLRGRVSSQVRKDFAEGAVVSVAGWILSVTEAQLYALAALSE